jgi:hypothetical protein
VDTALPFAFLFVAKVPTPTSSHLGLEPFLVVFCKVAPRSVVILVPGRIVPDERKDHDRKSDDPRVVERVCCNRVDGRER